MRQRIVLALGLTLLAIVAVPLAVFLGIAGLIWKIMNWLLERSDVKCSKIAALLLLPVLLCTAGCSVKSGIRSGYEKVISAMGTLTPTPNAALIGVRTPGRDDCTGAYAASCEKARGKDVVFGGCGLQTRRLEITGSVSCQAGFVQILLKNGSKEIRLTPNSSGSIAESICGAGGDWYLSVEYADFSGSVTLCSRDSTQ